MEPKIYKIHHEFYARSVILYPYAVFMYIRIILPFTSRFLKWSLFLWFYVLRISHFSHVLHVPFSKLKAFWSGILILNMMIIIMVFILKKLRSRSYDTEFELSRSKPTHMN